MTQTTDPIAEFETAVSAMQRAGMDRTDAVAHVARNNREMTAAYCRAYTDQQRTGPARRSTDADSRATIGIVKFEAAVTKRVDSGMDRKDAIADVSRNCPELHADYVAGCTHRYNRATR